MTILRACDCSHPTKLYTHTHYPSRTLLRIRMLRYTSFRLQRRVGSLGLTAALRQHRTSSFQPFTSQDEEDLVRVIKTRPRHVLKHVRQQVWRSRKKELYFRNTVTHLMIILQDFLRKHLIDPAYASQIMEGILEECVTYSQHDMAHLLFRTFLRFRKYGCTISVNSIRFLFESYKANDSKELMLQLANEMKADTALRPLCIAAFLFAGCEAEAEALMKDMEWNELSKDDILALVAGYEKLNRVDKNMEMLKRLPDRTFAEAERTEIYAAFLRSLQKSDNDALFTEVFQAAVDAGVKFDSDIFSTVLRQKMRRVTSAEEINAIEAELKNLGYVPDVTGSSIIITAFARLRHFGDRGDEELMLSKVDALLSSIESRLKQGDPDMDISATHIRAVIRGYGTARRPEALKDAWVRLQFKGITNDVRVYNELFKWYALMGNVKDVLALREEMGKTGVHPDSLTYTWILRALGKFYPRHVSQIHKEIEERRVRPDIQLYNTLIGLLGDLQKLDCVDALFSNMRQREEAGTLQLTPITFAVLIRIYSRDLKRAEQLYEEAKKRNLSDHSHVQTSMLHVYASLPDSTEKIDCFLSAIPVWDTDVYNVLLNMYGKRRNRDKFDETLQKMKNEQVAMNDVTFGTLITAFARWKDIDQVNGVMELLKEHEGEVSAAFYSVLASSLNRIGDAEGVTNAWEDLITSKLFPDMDVYNQFLVLYSRQHNLPKMHGVLDNMMKQVPPNPVTATTVLDMLGKSGRVAEMESLFEDMKSTPDTQPTSVTFHQVMNAYAKSGDNVKMESVHDEFLARGYANNAITYNILMDGYGRSKAFEQMEEVLQKRKSSGIPPDDIMYCILASAYGKAKSEKDVIRIFEELNDSANTPMLTKRTIWSCIDAFCRCGNADYMEKCIEMLRSANDSAQLLPSDYSALIPYYCRMGLMEKVESIEEDLRKTSLELSYSALNAVARGYSKGGRFDKTVETLHKMRDRNWVPDASTALQLSGAFLKAGLHEQAKQIIEWRRQYARAASLEAVTSPTKE